MSENNEETFLLAIHAPLHQLSFKPYKIMKKLRSMIDTVTKNYSEDGTYTNEKKDGDNITYELVFVFKFYNKQEYEKVNHMLRTLNAVF